jgi:hypothetical protein
VFHGQSGANLKTVHLLYTDEVNMDPDNSEFFVYAGVSIPGENAAALHADIEALRKRNGYKPVIC